MADTQDTITEGCMVLLQKGSSYIKSCKVSAGRPQALGRRKESLTISFEGVAGEVFGQTFRLVPTGKKNNFKLAKMTWEELMQEQVAVEDCGSGLDNRDLVDDGASQKLSKEEIVDLRASGLTGEELIQTLAANSTTFSGKTKFAQEKYVRKKGKKYTESVTLHRPTVDLVADMLYGLEPWRIANLRPDMLFQLLNHGNVGAGTRVAVFEAGTAALVTTAAVARVGRTGRLVHVFAGSQPLPAQTWTAMACMNFTEAQLAAVSYININRINTVAKPGKPECSNAELVIDDELFSDRRRMENGNDNPHHSHNKDDAMKPKQEVNIDEHTKEHKDKRTSEHMDTTEDNSSSIEDCSNSKESHSREKSAVAGEITNTTKAADDTVPKNRKFVRPRSADERVSSQVLRAGVWSLLIACKQYRPLEPTLALLPYLLPGCPFAVFCPYLEPLLELYQELKIIGGTNLHLTDSSWLREYQVLPERTHPAVTMSGGGGYMLCGTKIRVGDQF